MTLTISESNSPITFGTYNDVAGDQHNKVYNKTTNIEGDQVRIRKEVVGVLEVLMRASSASAAFNSSYRYPPAKCFEGTRRDILETISSWIKNPGQHRIIWINDVAGMGKSSLAQSLAELCDKNGSLGASFFFSKADASRNSHRTFFATIAYQLHVAWPILKYWTRRTLKKNPSIPYNSPKDQLHNLVIKPIQDRITTQEVTGRMGPSKHRPIESYWEPKVVIIDSIDECGDGDVGELATLLIEAAKTPLVPLYFIITSQFDQAIADRFKGSDIVSTIELRNYPADADICLFLQSELNRIAKKSGLETPWPTDNELDKLVSLSSGLFIYAATVLKFIDTKNSNPRRQLNIVLTVDQSGPHYLYADLDRLYKRILSEIPAQVYEDQVRGILGAAILLVHPLRLEGFDDLLQLERGDTWIGMQGLHAFFVIPERDDPSETATMRLVHTIFRHFLTHRERSGIFFVDPITQHSYIAHCCFIAMIKGLTKDMCNINDATLHNSQIPGLSDTCKGAISNALGYAVRYWSNHLVQTELSSVLIADLSEFAEKVILFWIESLSLLGNTETILPAIQQVLSTLKSTPNPPQNTIQILERVQDLVTPSLNLIRDMALYIYALDSAPSPKDMDRDSLLQTLTSSTPDVYISSTNTEEMFSLDKPTQSVYMTSSNIETPSIVKKTPKHAHVTLTNAEETSSDRSIQDVYMDTVSVMKEAPKHTHITSVDAGETASDKTIEDIYTTSKKKKLRPINTERTPSLAKPAKDVHTTLTSTEKPPISRELTQGHNAGLTGFRGTTRESDDREKYPEHWSEFSCRSCHQAIRGYRYQCGQCSIKNGFSYDLCQTCVSKSLCAHHGVKAWYAISNGEPLVSIVGHCEQCKTKQKRKEKYLRCFECTPNQTTDWCLRCSSESHQHKAAHSAAVLLARIEGKSRDGANTHDPSCNNWDCEGECRVYCDSCITYIGQANQYHCRTCSSSDVTYILCPSCIRTTLSHGNHVLATYGVGGQLSCDKCGTSIGPGEKWKRCITCPSFPGFDLCGRCINDFEKMGHQHHRFATCTR